MMNDDTGWRKRVLAALTCGALCITLLACLMPLAAKAPFGSYRAEHVLLFPKTWGSLWLLAAEGPFLVGIAIVTLCLMLYFWWIAWEPEPKYRPRGSRSKPWLP